MKLLFLTIFTISICVEARIFPAKNSEPLLDASSPQSSLSAGLSSTQLASLLLSSPNYAPQLRRLFGLDVQQQQQSPQSAAAGNPSIVYPAVAVDEDGDGSVDLWMINQQTLPFGDEAQQQPLPNNNMPLPYAAVGYNINRRIVGRQINGQPVKVGGILLKGYKLVPAGSVPISFAFIEQTHQQELG
jgi:hypothetical protein